MMDTLHVKYSMQPALAAAFNLGRSIVFDLKKHQNRRSRCDSMGGNELAPTPEFLSSQDHPLA